MTPISVATSSDADDLVDLALARVPRRRPPGRCAARGSAGAAAPRSRAAPARPAPPAPAPAGRPASGRRDGGARRGRRSGGRHGSFSPTRRRALTPCGAVAAECRTRDETAAHAPRRPGSVLVAADAGAGRGQREEGEDDAHDERQVAGLVAVVPPDHQEQRRSAPPASPSIQQRQAPHGYSSFARIRRKTTVTARDGAATVPASVPRHGRRARRDPRRGAGRDNRGARGRGSGRPRPPGRLA